eukprot:scaffold541_cov335-Pavlova_lutheri.AAC.26
MFISLPSSSLNTLDPPFPPPNLARPLHVHPSHSSYLRRHSSYRESRLSIALFGFSISPALTPSFSILLLRCIHRSRTCRGTRLQSGIRRLDLDLSSLLGLNEFPKPRRPMEDGQKWDGDQGGRRSS